MACNSWASDAGCVQVDGCPDYCTGITNTQLHAGGAGCPDQVVLTHGLAVYGDSGGGKWYWDASQDKANANFGIIIDPSVAFSLAAQGTGTGTGCWVREFSDIINASWFGVSTDSSDITDALQKALDLSGHIHVDAGTYTIGAPAVGNNYIGLIIYGDTILSGEVGTVFELAASSEETYYIFRVDYTADNVVLRDFKVVGDRYIHNGSTGEWGHGIAVMGAGSYITLERLHISACWGDGIYIGNGKPANLNYITVRDCSCDDNRRQGCSITAGKGIVIVGSTFSNTNGTAPESGLDVEPNVHSDATWTVRDLTIRDCEFTDNGASGLILYGTLIPVDDETDSIRDVVISDCVMQGNTEKGLSSVYATNVTIDKCHMISNGTYAVWIGSYSVNNRVCNNRIEHTGSESAVYHQNTSNRGVIDSNYIEGDDTTGVGITLNGSYQVVISNNHIRNMDRAIVVESNKYCHFINNVIMNADNPGIALTQGANQNFIIGNQLRNVAKTGLAIDGAGISVSGDSQNNQFKQNSFTNDSGTLSDTYYYFGGANTYGNIARGDFYMGVLVSEKLETDSAHDNFVYNDDNLVYT